MKVYNSFGPNPRALRMFLAEKGLTVPMQDVDLMAAENRKPPYTERNPGGQLPSLELDNGKTIGETVAIFDYLEEKQSQASTHRSDGRGARRDPSVAAPRRAEHHREHL